MCQQPGGASPEKKVGPSVSDLWRAPQGRGFFRILGGIPACLRKIVQFKADFSAFIFPAAQLKYLIMKTEMLLIKLDNKNAPRGMRPCHFRKILSGARQHRPIKSKALFLKAAEVRQSGMNSAESPERLCRPAAAPPAIIITGMPRT